MAASRTIHVVFVSPEKPVGYSPEMQADKTVAYAGEAVEVKF
jgi:hypothetical protein